jgi:uncharacterized RDD family membrane protein YckC
MDAHILSEVEQEIYLQPTTLSKRFLNLLLDIIGFYMVAFVFGIALGAVQLSTGQDIYPDHSNLLLEYAVSYLCYFTYYALVEGLSKGRSLGKLITGTIAVRSDGSSITWKDALLRSLCRLVPFEAFSALGYAPWHDQWTKTTVVKKAI